MDEPYKLQLAINIAGLPRILLATVCSAVTKLFGKKGVFYKVAGHGIDGIDGFYMGSSFDIYHDLAILNPKEPDKLVNDIYEKCGVKSMIVDANDLSIEIFAKCDQLESVPDPFRYVVSEEKADQFHILRSLMERPDVTELVNACDAGREGELIFRFVYEVAGCRKPTRRLWISSMEEAAIKRSEERRVGKECRSRWSPYH